MGSWQAQVPLHLGFRGRLKAKSPKYFEHSSKGEKQPNEYCPQTVGMKQIQALS